MEFDYVLSYKDDGRKASLTLYSVRKGGALSTVLVRLSGLPAKKGYEELVKLLAERGGMALVRSEPSGSDYSIRPDLAPVVGSFMLLLRRSGNPSKWCKAFNEIMRGRSMVFGECFAEFFNMAVNTSIALKKALGKRARGETLIPDVCDAISASIKSFVSFIMELV